LSAVPKAVQKIVENEHGNRQHSSEIFLLTSNFITSWSVFANHCYLFGPLSFSCTVGALQHTNFFTKSWKSLGLIQL